MTTWACYEEAVSTVLHYRPQGLSTGDNHPALFTAVSDYASFHSLEFFEIISLRVGGLKTFWTIAIWQVGGVDGQMAMATPYPVVLCRQEHELAMRAGGHSAYHPREVLERR